MADLAKQINIDALDGETCRAALATLLNPNNDAHIGRAAVWELFDVLRAEKDQGKWGAIIVRHAAARAVLDEIAPELMLHKLR